MEEIHFGTCGHHAAPRTLVSMAFQHAFFWLSTKEDVADLVKKCNKCQRFAKQSHMPAMASRQFQSHGRLRFGVRLDRTYEDGAREIQISPSRRLQVHQVDCGEAGYQPRNKADNQVHLKNNPPFWHAYSIIADNGTNFKSKQFRDYCSNGPIKLDFVSVAHLQSNGLILGGFDA